MSWKDAQKEAQQWLDKVQANQLLKEHGEPLDLRPFADQLIAQGNFRTMVLNAVKRKLKKKGVTFYLPE